MDLYSIAEVKLGQCGRELHRQRRWGGEVAAKPDISLETIPAAARPGGGCHSSSVRAAGEPVLLSYTGPDREPLAAKRFRKPAHLA